MYSKLSRKLHNFFLIPTVFKNWFKVWVYLLIIYMPFTGLKVATPIVHLRSSIKLKIRLKNVLDIGSILETHTKKEYTPVKLRVPENAAIIDIGASIGDFSIFCASFFKGSSCFCFEPNMVAYKICQENISLNNLQSRIKCYPLAVSNKAGEMMIGKDMFEAITFDQIFTDNKIDKCDLLKIDIEGAEYAMLMNTAKDTLKRIMAITMECHIYSDKGEELSKLKQYLLEQGFQVETTPISTHRVCYLYAFRQILNKGVS